MKIFCGPLLPILPRPDWEFAKELHRVKYIHLKALAFFQKPFHLAFKQTILIAEMITAILEKHLKIWADLEDRFLDITDFNSSLCKPSQLNCLMHKNPKTHLSPENNCQKSAVRQAGVTFEALECCCCPSVNSPFKSFCSNIKIGQQPLTAFWHPHQSSANNTVILPKET